LALTTAVDPKSYALLYEARSRLAAENQKRDCHSILGEFMFLRFCARTAAVVGLSLIVSGCSKPVDDVNETATAEVESGFAPVTAERILNHETNQKEWLTYGGTYEEQRFSTLDQINEQNVNELGLAWHFDINTNRSIESTPIVANGMLFATSAWGVVYALDAVSGELIWSFDPQVPPEWGRYACCGVHNRGAAIWGDTLFVATTDGYLIALDASNGDVRWRTDTIDRQAPFTITGAPRVANGKVVIGNGGAEYGVRGYVTAYDAESGEQVWRFYTVPGNPADGFESDTMKKAAATWTGEWWKYGGGGTTWDAIVYDPEFDVFYLGVGNGSPWDRNIRSPGGGDNLFLSSIVAVDANTGKYVWHYQTTPGDTWDYTSTQPITLADLVIDGEQRKVLMQAPKNGFFYVIDRVDGKLISAEPYVPLNWATHVDLETGRPVETPGARYQENYKIIFPSSWGAHNWHPQSFSPLTGLMYIPVIGTPEIFKSDSEFVFREGHWNVGTDWSAFAPQEEWDAFPRISMRLAAWDPVAQKEVFRIEGGGEWNAGVLSTAGNLLFQGDQAGEFAAFTADTGEKLWSAHAGTAIQAGPVTYEIDGQQYVTVVGGWGVGLGSFQGDPAEDPDLDAIGRVLTYRLGGNASAPPASAIKRTVGNLPDLGASAETITQGEGVFLQYCSVCHGLKTVGIGTHPDLRYASEATHQSWTAIVLGGAYASKGMPDFGDVLTVEDVLAVQAYVIEQARLIGTN
jgi:quinohemoprotein ethanol dehydrogenase